MNTPSVLLDAIRANTRPVGDHLLWTGPADRGTPTIKRAGTRYPVRRVVLEHRLGRKLAGQVKPVCGEITCIADGHLMDSIGRREAAAAGTPVKSIPAKRTGQTGVRNYKRGVAEPGQIPDGAIAAFYERLHHVGEHRVWLGTSKDTTPRLVHLNTWYSALQVAWVLHHGTRPVGMVLSSCDVRLCVAGPCLTDQVMRQADQKLMAALWGKKLDGACPHGHARAEFGMVTAAGRIDCLRCDTIRRERHRSRKRAAAGVAA